MIRKKRNQLSFAQFQVSDCIAKADLLQDVNEIIDWKPIRRILANLHPARVGRPAYDPVFMFKILLLQQWFNLSDPQWVWISQKQDQTTGLNEIVKGHRRETPDTALRLSQVFGMSADFWLG